VSALSLRARLVLGVIVLSAIGLVLANVATYSALRSFLIDRTDEALAEAHAGVEREVFRGGPPRGRGGPIAGLAPGDFVELRAGDGDILFSQQMVRFGHSPPAPPRLPQPIDVAGGARYGTAEAAEGDGRYRFVASSLPGAGATLIVARPLDDVDETLKRLLVLEIVVGAAVLLALGALGLWVVRLGLRPLEEIEATAGAIAAGDLSRRVERAEPTTEVGRLGLALNAMLGQIESAFRAREASERKLRRFVADASHELRTPLSAVRAYAELFERGAETRPDDLARAMAGITGESERMSLLVDDLLLLARLDEGRPLDRERVALDEVVAEAVETARTLEPQRRIELEREDVAVVGDRARLRQVVDNLLSNVRAHTPAEAAVRVRVARDDGAALVEVADSGPGLSAEETERVFERFYRADPSRARASGGVGLGLSIVAAVTRAHGGTASARSGPNGGATFEIRLPAAGDLTGSSQRESSRS
jgi:two-component system, OmpR family, sensor kinase